MTPQLYGSRATSPSANCRRDDGGLLRDGAQLPLGDVASTDAEMTPEWQGSDLLDGEVAHLRAVPGPQDDRFTSAALATFSARLIGALLNRMGMRLEGPGLAHVDADIPSDGIVTGSVQVPGNGQPIILLADHQTTGGYTKIATVSVRTCRNWRACGRGWRFVSAD